MARISKDDSPSIDPSSKIVISHLNGTHKHRSLSKLRGGTEPCFRGERVSPSPSESFGYSRVIRCTLMQVTFWTNFKEKYCKLFFTETKNSLWSSGLERKHTSALQNFDCGSESMPLQPPPPFTFYAYVGTLQSCKLKFWQCSYFEFFLRGPKHYFFLHVKLAYTNYLFLSDETC